MKTSSIVVTVTPNPSTPRALLSASSLLNKTGKEGAEHAGRTKEDSAPMSITCLASGTNDLTSCFTHSKLYDTDLVIVRR